MIAVLAGAGVGLGVWLLITSLVPARPSLAEMLARLDYQPGQPPPPPASLDERVGRLLERTFGADRLANGRPPADLALLDISTSTFMGSKVAAALIGLLVGPALAVAAGLGGIQVAWTFPAVAAIALATLGFFIPDIDLRAKAEQRRRAFRRSLSAFLDVLALSMAAGQLISGALQLAARSGEGWAFVLLRQALEDADQRGGTPWGALAALGEQRGLPELVEVAASVRLAGTDGARIRRSLAVKAASLRTRALADIEAEAAEATTRMVLPLVAVAFGFLVLVGYPAVIHILGGA